MIKILDVTFGQKLTFCFFRMVSFPLNVADVLDNTLLVELLRQHFWRLAVIVTSTKDMCGALSLTHEKFKTWKMAFHS